MSPSLATVKICTEQLTSPGGGDKVDVPTDACSGTHCTAINQSPVVVGEWNSDPLMGATLYQFTPMVIYTFDDSPPQTICDIQSSLEVCTPEGIPTEPPRNVSFSPPDLGDENFTITWLPPSPTGQNGLITHYVVDLEDGTSRNVTAEEGSPSYSEVYHPYLDYSYSVSACTSTGCGQPSDRGHYTRQLSSGSAVEKGTFL